MTSSFESSYLTPIDRKYATCDETHLELRIYPGHKSPEEISELLRIEPTRTQIKGTFVKNSRGRSREIKITGWFLSSEGIVASRDLREHVDWLITKLGSATRALQLLQESVDTKMTVSCTWWSAAGHGGPALSPVQMAALSELNLEVSFDIYFSENE